MSAQQRTFTTTPAVRSAVPLWIAFMGPSGGGKTFSGLRVATGVQSVTGGEIHMIDTEAGRGLHYADDFRYQYTPLTAPFGSLDYLAAIQHVYAKGARIILIDSMSHEHDGEGGLIDSQEAEVQRMAGDNWQKRESVKMLAWTKPKAARKRLIAGMLALSDVTFILCFRADDQSKPVKKDGEKMEVVHMGFMPVAGKNFVYEATLSALLLPGANGVPTWTPEFVGEKMMRKLPRQFQAMFQDGQPLSEEHGRLMAEWARGSVAAPEKSASERAAAVKAALKRAASTAKLADVWQRAEGLRRDLTAADPTLLADLELTYEARVAELNS